MPALSPSLHKALHEFAAGGELPPLTQFRALLRRQLLALKNTPEGILTVLTGAGLELLTGMAPRTCRKCGCTDENCRQRIEKEGQPCTWVELDLCSACVGARVTGPDAPHVKGAARMAAHQAHTEELRKVRKMPREQTLELLTAIQRQVGASKRVWLSMDQSRETVITGLDEGEDGAPVVRRKVGPLQEITLHLVMDMGEPMDTASANPTRAAAPKGKTHA